MKKKFFAFILAALTVLALSVTAFAATPPTIDVTEIITSGVTDIVGQLLLILGGVTGVVIGYMVVKMGINKGIQLFRSMLGRAG